ncbi:hypothetical protein ACFVSX_24570 [Streptomyces rubiginosohelvolus]
MTVATILYDEGWLTRRKQGQAWLYTPPGAHLHGVLYSCREVRQA